jgi:hypothetical protein
MAPEGQALIISKIVTDRTVLERADIFPYLECKMLYEEGTFITSRISSYIRANSTDNSEQCFETKVRAKRVWIERRYIIF